MTLNRTMSERWNNVRQWLWHAGKLALPIILIAGVVYWVMLSPIPVTQHPIKYGPIVSEVMGTGTLEARIDVTVSPKISGRIEEVLVDQGGQVTAGSLLVRLEDSDLQQQVAIASANLDAAQSAIERLTFDKDRAEVLTAQARRQNRTTQSLFVKNAATEDEAESTAEALAAAEATLSRSQAAITEGQNQLVAAEKTLEYQRARLADTRIVAPFDGLIVRRHRESGDIVVPGSAVLSLISTKELWGSAWVDETEMEKLAIGQTARIVFRSDPDRSYPGTVARLGREVDRETREFIVDVRVLELPKNWAVGQRAEVFVEWARKESVLLVPTRFLTLKNNQTGVFVNINGQARWRRLTLGLRSPDKVEVVAGLEAEETVVTPVDAKAVLRDGRKVSGR